MSLQEALARVESRYRELTDALSDPAVLAQPKQRTSAAKERAALESLNGDVANEAGRDQPLR